MTISKDEEVDAVKRTLELSKTRSNPFICVSKHGDVTIGFKTMGTLYKDALWWVGTGFKDTGMVRDIPVMYESRESAERAIREELIDFIRKYRSDQVHLIFGW